MNECSGGYCVAVWPQDRQVKVWSTRRPDEIAWIEADEWSVFLDEVKAGKYDTVV
jgi:hypothetical protein